LGHARFPPGSVSFASSRLVTFPNLAAGSYVTGDEMMWLQTLCGGADGSVVDLEKSQLLDQGDQYGEADIVLA